MKTGGVIRSQSGASNIWNMKTGGVIRSQSGASNLCNILYCIVKFAF